MKQQIKTLAALVLSSLLLFSCSKDDTGKNTKTKTELLTSGTWKTVAYTINPGIDWNGDGVMISDIFSQFEACEKDDQVTFKGNGEVIEDLKTLCEAHAGGTTDTFNWKFSNNETTLTLIYNPGEESSFKIVELTATTLKLSDTYTEDGVSYTDTWTFSH